MKEPNTMRCMQRFAVVAAVVLAVTGAGTGRAPAQQAGERDWFHLDTTLAEGWQAVEVGGEKSSVLLRSADSVGAGARRHILSLQARASSAYDVALSEVARVLGQKRISSDILAVNYEDEGNRAASALKQAERSGFDMVLATGSEATAWLLKTYRGGRLPVVSVCAKDPVALGQAKNYTDGTGTNFALTSLNLPADVQMAYALELMPGLRNLAIIVDGQNISAMETQALPIAAQAQARGIRVLNVTVQNPGRAAEELDRLVGDAVEAMRLNDVTLESSLFLVTGSTSVFEQMGIVNARASRVPVISMVPETVHEGSTSAVLSIGVSFRSNAHLAAVYAAGILERGQRPGSLKIGVLTPPDIEINFRRAREIGLKIPFTFFESANIIYDYADKPVRTTSAADR